MIPQDRWYQSNRLGGLRRFAVAITLFNILGHTLFGFEQSWAQPLVALATAYSMEFLIELLHAWSDRRTPRFVGGMRSTVDFLLSAHITGLAVAMLLYTNDRLWPIVFATAVATGSKAIFRAPVGKGTRHIFNPSNFGITMTLVLFPWIGIAPPYHFTENLSGVGDWLLPGLIVASGTFVNARFTQRLPLIAAWVGGFLIQGLFRSVLQEIPIVTTWLPMTGVAFILYTFYMLTDPATTPSSPRVQVVFGVAVASVYGLLLLAHVVFGFFFALTLVCTVRGLCLYAPTIAGRLVPTEVTVETPVVAGKAEA